MHHSSYNYGTALCLDDVTPMRMCGSDVIAAWPFKQPNRRNLDEMPREDGSSWNQQECQQCNTEGHHLTGKSGHNVLICSAY